MSSVFRRIAAVTVAILVLGVVGAVGAQAATTVRVAGLLGNSSLIFDAATSPTSANESDRATVFYEPDQTRIRIVMLGGVLVTPGSGCTGGGLVGTDPSSTIVCSTVGLAGLPTSTTWNLGAGDDSVAFSGWGLDGAPPVNTIDGGAGDDDLSAPDRAASTNTVTGGVGADTLTGHAGDDTLHPGSATAGTDSGQDTMIGGTGTDTVSYAVETADIPVSLDGVANDGPGGTDNVGGSAATAGDEIENITTGTGDDTISGNALANVIDAGAGSDTIDYSAASSAVTVNLGLSTATQGRAGEHDTLHGFENARGGAGDDVITGTDVTDTANALTGNGGNDTIDGRAGADTLDGGLGQDTLDGGAGVDTATYASRTAGVTVTIGGVANGEPGENDSFTAIENAAGGSGDDALTGNTGANGLTGNGGDDTLVGGLGADDFAGGAGVDTVDYSQDGRLTGVTVSADGVPDAGAELDNVHADVEGLTGTAAGDSLTGNALDNTLVGLAGDDTLDGGSNQDALIGGLGADLTIGGSGAGDTVSYADASHDALGVVADLDGVLGDDGAGCPGTCEGDRIDATVENLVGTQAQDVLTGSTNTSTANHLSGRGGDDVLDGGSEPAPGASPQTDTLDGGSGTDRVSYAGRTDDLTVALNGYPASGGRTGTAENDAFTSIENVSTGSGADTVTATDTPSRANAVDCGPGTDTATADALDTLTGCELPSPGAQPAAAALSVDDPSVTEGDSATKTLAFAVSIPAAVDYDVSVGYATADGTATTADGDYAATSGTATISAGTTSATVNVAVTGDTTIEDDETFTVDLADASPSTGAVIADAHGTGTITNDDLPDLGIGDASITEGDAGTRALTFTITQSAVAFKATTVHYATADGTATTADGDYTAVADAVATIPAGATSTTVDVALTPDTKVETDETLVVDLTSPSGATLADARGTGQILNDDAASLSIDDPAVTEGDSGTKSLRFTVTQSAMSALDTTVGYATSDGTATTADGDYAATTGTATISAGQTTATVDVPIAGDTTIEVDETLTVSLGGAVHAAIGDGQGQGTVTDDDTPALSIDDPTISEGDAGTKNLTFTIAQDKATAVSTTVHYATADGTATTADGDYTAVTDTTATIAPGQTSTTVTVPIAGDTKVEGDETVLVALGNPANATILDAHGTGTLGNDDAYPVIARPADVTVAEGNSGTTNTTFTVQLSKAYVEDVTVRATTLALTAGAAAGDYTAVAATLTFPAGSTQAQVSVPVRGDVTFEADETFGLELSGPVRATLAGGAARLRATGTITNDDAAPIPPTPAFTVDDPRMAEGDSGEAKLVFTVRLTPGRAAPASVRFVTADGTAVAPLDYLGRLGTLTFDAGQTSRQVAIKVIGDRRVEKAETVQLTLSGASAGTTLAKAVGVGTIGDDDATTCRVPQVKGLRLSAAKARIKTAGCTVGRTVRRTSATVVKGRAIRTSPQVGQVLKRGAKVTLTVSAGPKATAR